MGRGAASFQSCKLSFCTPCLKQQLVVHAVTLTGFFLSWSSAYALKLNNISNVGVALNLVLDLFCIGSVMDKKMTRRLNMIPTEKEYMI